MQPGMTATSTIKVVMHTMDALHTPVKSKIKDGKDLNLSLTGCRATKTMKAIVILIQRNTQNTMAAT